MKTKRKRNSLNFSKMIESTSPGRKETIEVLYVAS